MSSAEHDNSSGSGPFVLHLPADVQQVLCVDVPRLIAEALDPTPVHFLDRFAITQKWQADLEDAVRRGEVTKRYPRSHRVEEAVMNIRELRKFVEDRGLAVVFGDAEANELDATIDHQFPEPVEKSFKAPDVAAPDETPQHIAASSVHCGETTASGLSKRERQIRAIVTAAISAGFDPIRIPTGGKSKLREQCMKANIQLFGAGKDPFDDAWTDARKSTPPRLRMAEHSKFAKR